MHQDFPKLFSEISTDGAQRDQRWNGIKTYVKDYTLPRIEVLARLAFATKPPPGGRQQDDLAAALEAFYEALSDSDPTIQRGSRQDQILAAGALMQYFTFNSFAAMAVTTTACGGARKANFPVDLVTAAENALSYLAAIRRKRPNLNKIEIEAPAIEFEPNFDNVQPNSPTTYKGVFDQYASVVDEAFAELVSNFNKATKSLADAGKKADEELDMLSWVFGQRALVPSQAFTDFIVDQKPLVFARDLASLTTIYPGPNSVPALLTRAGIKTTGKIKLTDAVNAVSDEWTATALTDRNPSPATSPIHFALAKRQETGAGDGWHAGWAAITGIDVTTTMSPLALAVLFYREILWLR